MQSQAYVVFLLLWVHVPLIALNELGCTHGTDVGVHSVSVEALLQKKPVAGEMPTVIVMGVQVVACC